MVIMQQGGEINNILTQQLQSLHDVVTVRSGLYKNNFYDTLT